jgi:hypothetical protein
VHEGKLCDIIAINTGDRDIPSPIIFLMVMDADMNKVILAKERN